MYDLRGNGVDAVDGTQGDNVLVGAAAVFNAGGLDGNEDGCSLPYFVVEAGLTQGVDYEVQTASRLGPVKGYDL